MDSLTLRRITRLNIAVIIVVEAGKRNSRKHVRRWLLDKSLANNEYAIILAQKRIFTQFLNYVQK